MREKRLNFFISLQLVCKFCDITAFKLRAIILYSYIILFVSIFVFPGKSIKFSNFKTKKFMALCHGQVLVVIMVGVV